MTNTEIFKKAFWKTYQNGYVLSDLVSGEFTSSRLQIDKYGNFNNYNGHINEIIFCHDFCKAFWVIKIYG